MKDINSELIIKVKQLSAEKINENKKSPIEEHLEIIKVILERNDLTEVFQILADKRTIEEPLYITLENILFSEMYKSAIKDDYKLKRHEAIMYLAFTLETNEILLNKFYFNNEVQTQNIKDLFFNNVKDLLNLYEIEEVKISKILELLNNEENIRYIIKKELI